MEKLESHKRQQERDIKRDKRYKMTDNELIEVLKEFGYSKE